MSTQPLGLGAVVTDELVALLPRVAQDTVAAVIEEVPSYSTAIQGPMRETINQAAQMALRGFLTIGVRQLGRGPGTLHRATLDGAYAQGRGEARSGRSMDALLAAYRVGAGVSWRGWSSAESVRAMSGDTIATFAEMVF